MQQNCILIPSYKLHLEYVDKLLFSIREKTPNNLEIYIIISHTDVSDFFYLRNKYNVNLLIFSQIINLIEQIDLSEDVMLQECGKATYQSLKKYYGLYYLFFFKNYLNVIIFDSESFIIRNIDINELITAYTKNPYIIYSNIPHYGDQLKIDVEKSAKIVTNTIDISAWFLEYYLWIYEKHIFLDFVQSVLLLFGERFYYIAKKLKTVFIEVVYQTYIYKNNSMYQYQMIEFIDYMATNKPEYLADSLHLININTPNKPIEDARQYIEKDVGDVFADTVYDGLKLQFYKTNDTIKSLDFIKKHTNIKICVSEYSDIIFNYFNDTYNTNFLNKWKCIIRNTLGIDTNLFRINKTFESIMPFHWLGYEIHFPIDTIVKFSFDLFFSALTNSNNSDKSHFIALKHHHPEELYPITISPYCLYNWTSFDVLIQVTEDKNDLYLILFDNAPSCDVLIRNFNFTIIEKNEK